MAVLLTVHAYSALPVSLSDQGTDVINKTSGSTINGDLAVLVYDAATGGSLIYNETFANAIANGSWNVMLGENASNPLNLEFGKIYYKDYLIAGEDANFTNLTGGQVDRQFFYSPLGDILFANYPANLTVDGRIGIGTATPTRALTVIGNGSFSGLSLTVNGTEVCLSNGTNCVAVGNATLETGWTDDGGTVRLTTLTDNVSIGTLTSNATFNIQGPSAGGNGFHLRAGENDGVDYIMHIEDADTTVQALYIDAGGETGFGTTSPQNRIDIAGNAVIGSSYAGSNTAPSNGLLVEGSMGIGTTLPLAKLDVNDDIRIGGSTPTLTLTDTVTTYETAINGTNLELRRDGNTALRILSDEVVEVDGFKMPAGAQNGHILTSDANGDASWEDPSTAISLDCTTETANGGGSATATCQAGYTITGGGCDGGIREIEQSYPDTDTSWHCDIQTGHSVTAYARCCRMN